MIESGRQTFMPIRTLDLHRVEHLTLRNNFAVTYKDPYYQVWLYLDNFFFSSTTWSSNRLSRKWVSNKSRETFLILETWLKNLNGKLPFGLVTKPQFANTSVNFSWVSFFYYYYLSSSLYWTKNEYAFTWSVACWFLKRMEKWYFVTKIVLTYCEKKWFWWLRKTFEIQGRELQKNWDH